jgi:hypothetical protein
VVARALIIADEGGSSGRIRVQGCSGDDLYRSRWGYEGYGQGMIVITKSVGVMMPDRPTPQATVEDIVAQRSPL